MLRAIRSAAEGDIKRARVLLCYAYDATRRARAVIIDVIDIVTSMIYDIRCYAGARYALLWRVRVEVIIITVFARHIAADVATLLPMMQRVLRYAISSIYAAVSPLYTI